MKTISPEESDRLSALIEAEGRAFELLDAIEAAHFIRPGRTERAIEQDIRELARIDFGVTRHWHKRVVRTGINTLAIASDNPPDRMVADDDIVFLDLGPVFVEWEADVGRSYAVGPDFEAIGQRYRAEQDRLFGYTIDEEQGERSVDRAAAIIGNIVTGPIAVGAHG